jgi:NAD(P)-dependent dehydrogenase (short-subunit alcohol dehydrogenase family)
MPGKIEGKRVVITGVSRGIGYHTAKLFLQEGARIIGIARDENRLKKVTEEFKKYGDFEGVVADLGMKGFEKDIVDAVSKKWGALDILINNAGVMLAYRGFLEDEDGVIEKTFQINLFAPYYLVRAMVPFLLKGKEPRIINVSSGAGTFEALSMYDIATYRISKFALNGFTIVLSNELKGKVAVNSLDPGWVKTDLGGPNAPGSPEESAVGALLLATMPFEVTGKFFKDGKEIPY